MPNKSRTYESGENEELICARTWLAQLVVTRRAKPGHRRKTLGSSQCECGDSIGIVLSPSMGVARMDIIMNTPAETFVGEVWAGVSWDQASRPQVQSSRSEGGTTNLGERYLKIGRRRWTE